MERQACFGSFLSVVQSTMAYLSLRASLWMRCLRVFAVLVLFYALARIAAKRADRILTAGGLVEEKEEVFPHRGALDNSTETRTAATTEPPLPCANLPGADDVLVVLKTGATEIYTKLPMQILTTLRCTPAALIVSDLAQDVGTHRIADVLADVSKFAMQESDDLRLYRTQKSYSRLLQDMAQLRGGWDLDKWKFLPMVRQAYLTHPEKKWFLFMEADTYVSWSNVLAWLARLDPTMPLYLGAEVWIGGTRFAHGGSGIVLSRAAMRRFWEQEQLLGREWEKKVPNECCGDKVLADALLDAGVELTGAAPGVQGERPGTLGFQREFWCVPVVSWHHVSSAEVDALWRFEQKWLERNGPHTPILFADYFAHFVEPYLQPSRSDWDNLSEDWTYTEGKMDIHVPDGADAAIFKEAHISGSECEAACRTHQECLQYAYEPDECRLHKSVKLGKPGHEQKRRVTSGWMMERIQDLRKELEPCDPEQGWVVPK